MGRRYAAWYGNRGMSNNIFLALCDEIADVTIMLEQLQMMIKHEYHSCEEFVANAKARKLKRLQERITIAINKEQSDE